MDNATNGTQPTTLANEADSLDRSMMEIHAEDARVAFTTEPRLSVYALCGACTANRADVPLSDVKRLHQMLGEWIEDPTGPIGCDYAPIPGVQR